MINDSIRKQLMKNPGNKPGCPRCDSIVKYSHQNNVPEFCPVCSYDLKKPVSKIKDFFHCLFWGSHRYVYPLARYYPETCLTEDSFNKMMKMVREKK